MLTERRSVEGEMALERLLSRYVAPIALACLFSGAGQALAATTIFADDFNRPDGLVGNGWIEATGSVAGSLVVKNGALTTTAADVGGGIYRPFNYSGTTTASAVITDVSGYGGLQNRFGTGFVFGSSAATSSRYEVSFYRGDQNYSNSQVILSFDGEQIGSAYSTFQFDSEIAATVSLTESGRVFGSVAGGGEEFSFEFGEIGSGISGSSAFGLYQTPPDSRSSMLTHGAIDNLVFSSGLSGDVQSIQEFSARYSDFQDAVSINNSYGLAYNGSDFVVSMNIAVLSSSITSDVLAEWKLGIESIWSGYEVATPFGYRDLRFEVSFNDYLRPIDATVFAPQMCKPSALYWCIDPIVYADGTSDAAMRGEVAAHEFGHLLGLFDEYAPGGIIDPSIGPDDLCLTYIGPGGAPAKQGNFCGSLMADRGLPQPRNYERILDQISAQTGFKVVLGNAPIYPSYAFPELKGDFIGFDASAVPEPGMWFLFIAGFGLLGSSLRRARAKFARATRYTQGREMHPVGMSQRLADLCITAQDSDADIQMQIRRRQA